MPSPSPTARWLHTLARGQLGNTSQHTHTQHTASDRDVGPLACFLLYFASMPLSYVVIFPLNNFEKHQTKNGSQDYSQLAHVALSS